MGLPDTSTELRVIGCCVCGLQFAVPAEIDDIWRRTHESWHCPRGHRQHYTGETRE